MGRRTLTELEVIGRIYSEGGIYTPDKIEFTLISGRKVELGEIVCIKHPRFSEKYVFYQVIDIPVRRRAKFYEEDLIRMGRYVEDPEKNYPRAIAQQIGYLDENDEVSMLLEHIKPMSEVYRPTTSLLMRLLKPKSTYTIQVGKIYPQLSLPLYLDLRLLLRQGLLVIGGVGTGKTTTMITVIISILEVMKENGITPHILIIDKDGEYACKELIALAEELGGFENVKVENVKPQVALSAENFYRKAISILGFTPQSKEGRAIKEAAFQARERGEKLIFNYETLHRIVNEYVMSLSIKQVVLSKLNRIKDKLEEEDEGKIDVEEFLNIVREKAVVILDCSTAPDWNIVLSVVSAILERVYDEALTNKDFGLIIVIDEVHFYSPQKGTFEIGEAHLYDTLEKVLKAKIATTGARNGITLFVSTQRLANVDKTLSTQVGQNIIAHRVEDVDLERLKEIVGSELISQIKLLPRGYAYVKSSATKIRRPLIVKIEPKGYPLSTERTCLYRWISSRNTSQLH